MTRVYAHLAAAAGAIVLSGALAGSGLAQDGTTPLAQKQYVIDLGIGGVVQPKYEASDAYLLYPLPLVSVGRFYLPVLGQVADGKKRQGVFLYPSFNFNGERKASDSSDLTGTTTVDWALELGLGAGYRWENFRVFAELRQGINGHTSQVGQLGFDAIFQPLEKVEFSIGPRAGFAAGDYMDTYFGVTAAEAAASGGTLTQYNPSGGFKSVGLSARASYDLTEDVRLHLQGSYDRLIGDAADSPIAKVGSEDQFSIGLGVTYRFAFDIF